jgi:hypothetical protein
MAGVDKPPLRLFTHKVKRVLDMTHIAAVVTEYPDIFNVPLECAMKRQLMNLGFCAHFLDDGAKIINITFQSPSEQAVQAPIVGINEAMC